MPKVSVIIPVYNVEKYLRECLESVVNQTLKDIEIICVNDGSTDNSLDILNEFSNKDNRVKIINKTNGGLSSARNAGMAAAQGEFIGFLDSDDYIDLNFYESLYNRAKETNSDIVVCEYIYRFKDKSKRKKTFLKVDKNVVTSDAKEKFECLYLPLYCYVHNKIYKKASIKENFVEGLNFEDIYFTTNILSDNNKMTVAENVAYYYRDHPNSIVNDNSNLNKYFYHKAMAYFYKFVHEHNIDVNTNKYCETKRYKFLGFTFLKLEKKYFKIRYNFLGIFKWSSTKIRVLKEFCYAES
ncbi:glycosyltransferase [bacterium]|nr:glycosyltransferase [bacterium]